MKAIYQILVFILLLFAALGVQAQKGSSIVIHDNTDKALGGENATSTLRKELESALNREKPCVDIMDDEDIRNVLQSEREKNLLEGGDPQQVLTNIGNFMNASYVMSVTASPGVGGTTQYTVVAMDPQTSKTVARQTGTDSRQIAESMVRQLGPSLADNCNPHWVGEVKYEFISTESKQTTDAGAMRANTRNTKRTKTDTYTAKSTITATLLPPQTGSAATAGKAMARVWMRSSIVSEKKQETTGEMNCRPKGENPVWKGYNLKYSETVTQLGGGAGTLPVLITVDAEGYYKIVVTTPGGTLLGKVETSRSESGCEGETNPTIEAVSMPGQTIDASGFDVTGKVEGKNRDHLAGSQTTPDGKTKITWSLRLMKPKQK